MQFKAFVPNFCVSLENRPKVNLGPKIVLAVMKVLFFAFRILAESALIFVFQMFKKIVR